MQSGQLANHLAVKIQLQLSSTRPGRHKVEIAHTLDNYVHQNPQVRRWHHSTLLPPHRNADSQSKCKWQKTTNEVVWSNIWFNHTSDQLSPKDPTREANIEYTKMSTNPFMSFVLFLNVTCKDEPSKVFLNSPWRGFVQLMKYMKTIWSD